MADNVQLLKTHISVINDSLKSNFERIGQTKQVITQYESQKQIFEEFPKSLKKSVLVPVGAKGFFRGQIVHTNEVYHKVGCGYVIKRSAAQALDFCERMLNETNNFLQKLYEEEKWLNGQLSVQEDAFKIGEQVEIVESYNQEEEEEWRVKHRESVRRMKQDEAIERQSQKMTDSDVFSMLDRLELMEEFDKKADESLLKSSSDESESSSYENIEINECNQMKTSTDSENSFENVELTDIECKVQNDVEINNRKIEIEKELKLAQQNKTVIKTEEDIFKRLDELEKEENLLEEMEILTSNELAPDDVEEKLMKIRFNEQVRTNFYDSTQAVSDEKSLEVLPAVIETDEPVTLEIRFSHSTNDVNVETSETPDLKPSDLYEMPYRLKSILKNKNRLFDEPQHTGDFVEEQPYHHVRKHRHRERSWVCQDSFKNGNDSDQENANKIPQPLTEVKEKTAEVNNLETAGTTPPPKKRQSRFSVSRALLTKK